MNQVVLIFSNPAHWIGPLLAILFWVGYRRTKPTVTKVRTLLFFPIIILAMSIKRMSGLSLNKVSLMAWAISIIVGGFLGWFLTRNRVVRADHDHGLICLPGSWVTLLSLLIIFSARYFFSSAFAAEPELRSDLAYVVSSMSLMGFFLGLFSGRVTGHLRQYRKTATSDLSGIHPDI